MGIDSLLTDLVVATREVFVTDSTNRIETIFRHQNYPFMNDMMGSDREKENSGRGLKWNIQLAEDNGASWRDQYGLDTLDLVNTLTEGDIRWARVNNRWIFDVDDVNMNRESPQRIVDLLNARRLASMKGRCDLMEEAFWSGLPDPDDTTQMFGITYWIVKGVTASSGWLGMNPTGYSDVGGIDASVTAGTGWRNYSARGAGYFSDYNEELVDTMIEMWDEIAFEGPQVVTDLAKNPSLNKFSIVMNRQTRAGLTKLQRQQNDAIGQEINKFNGSISFNNVPLRRASVLDADTTDPIYFLNRNKFKVHTLKGSDNREDDPRVVGDRHTVRVIHQDTTCQTVCVNRHEQGVISK